MAGGMSRERQLELAEQGVDNAKAELQRVLNRVRSAVAKIERRNEGNSVWSSDQIEDLTRSTAQVVAWNAVLTERRNYLRAVRTWDGVS